MMIPELWRSWSSISPSSWAGRRRSPTTAVGKRSRRLRLPDGSQVVLRSIRYAASDGHRVTLHCKDGDRTLRTSFAAVEPLLCAYPCFCGICRGVVVNFHEVAGRQEDVFLLKDGTRLPISRRRLREVQEAYSAFRFDRLRKDGVD